jgi:titin
MPRERPEEETEPSAPVFDLMPEAVQCEEGDTAKFMCKVGGHPRPRVTWWVNGAIIVNVSSNSSFHSYQICQ